MDDELESLQEEFDDLEFDGCPEYLGEIEDEIASLENLLKSKQREFDLIRIRFPEIQNWKGGVENYS